MDNEFKFLTERKELYKYGKKEEWNEFHSVGSELNMTTLPVRKSRSSITVGATGLLNSVC